ncbi:MAG: YeeE/YedE family protein [Proteobacteria bacterium]|nr:YeeE/YedE family protein [Pseudomonadota bacterium]
MKEPRQLAIWTLVGFVMSVGMSLGGMAHVSSLYFFDPFQTGENQRFDLAMLILFCAGLLPTFLYWQLFGKNAVPWLEPRWHLSTNRDVDRGLVVGSLMFGIGWAMGGFCPGPSVAGMITGNPNFVAFSYGMYAFFVVRHLLNPAEGDRHWGLSLALGLCPAVFYVVGPTLFPLQDAHRTVSWPVHLSIGGGLGIALASILMLQFNGRVLGLCGLWRNILDVDQSTISRLPHVLFFSAFLLGGVVTYLVAPESFAYPPHSERHLFWIFLGGVITGLGTTWANGCTSGHGISGMARLSPRSLVAVPMFMGGVFVFHPIFNVLLGG